MIINGELSFIKICQFTVNIYNEIIYNLNLRMHVFSGKSHLEHNAGSNNSSDYNI